MFCQLTRNTILREIKTFDPASVSQVRWRTKPRWLPVAKGKLFRVPKRPVVPLEEKLELMRINDNYNTQIRAVRLFFIKELKTERQSLANKSSEESKKEESVLFEKCRLENDAWNAAVGRAREERVAREAETRAQLVLKRKQYRDDTFRTRREKNEQMVQKLLEDSKSFITRDNIDAAIEKAMASHADYDYAIDLQGNIIKNNEIQSEENEENQKALT